MTREWYLDIVSTPSGLVLLAIDGRSHWVERRAIPEISISNLVAAVGSMLNRREMPDCFASDHARHWTGLADILGARWRPLKSAETMLVERIGRIVRDNEPSGFADIEAARVQAERRRSREIGKLQNSDSTFDHGVEGHSSFDLPGPKQRVPLYRRIIQRIFGRGRRHGE